MVLTHHHGLLAMRAIILAALFCCSSSFSPAVVLPSRSGFHASPRFPIRGPQVDSVLSESKATVHDEERGHQPVYSESVRRRHLLFSLLAASGSTFVPPKSALAEEELIVADFSTVEPNGIQRPPLDDRDYETLVLDNGLRVLLCSDPSSNGAAAAMDVHVGACSDPKDVPGLAHFNEHMLFLGTKKYPKEDSFEAFLSANGGSSNAFTDSENTVFFFSMEVESSVKFAEGLSRFGSFFTAPLFTESATGRELNAIDAENAKNLQSDAFRLYQLDKTRTNPKHPYSKFFTGNKKTLFDDTKAKGIDLRKQLIKFYNRYYSANQMTLAVVAPESLSDLKNLVIDSFSDVPNRKVGKPEVAWKDVPLFSEDSVIPSYQHIVEIVPVQDVRQIKLSFPVVYESDNERLVSLLNKQNTYVAHLIGHEGPGSLLSYVKRQNWANGIATSSDDDLSTFEAFEIAVDLTTQGLAHVESVAEAVFSYITMLREEPIPNYVFDEVLQLNELEWRFMTKGEPGGYAQSLATAMQKFPPSLYVAGPRRLALAESESTLASSSAPRDAFSSSEQAQMTKRLATDLINTLTVENLMVTILSKSFAKQTNKVEKWYGTEYSVRPISSELLRRWHNPVPARDIGIAYPKPNVFIPSEAGLRVKTSKTLADRYQTRTFESRMQPVTPPRVIRDDGMEGRWTVYFKEDDRFGQPKAFVVFQLLTKEVFSSASRAVLASLYQSCASDRLDEYAYDAALAGLSFDVQVTPRGVRLTFGGYNDKFQEFAAYIGKKLARDSKTILPKNDIDFERYKDNLMRAYSAFDVKQPYAHASYYAYLTMQQKGFQYTNAELRQALRKTTLPDLVSYVKSLWSSGKGEALIQGNLYEKEAQILVNTIDKALGFKTTRANQYPLRQKALPLPAMAEGTVPTLLSISEPNTSNTNSAVHVVIQSLGRTDKDHVLIEILNSLLSEPFYAELRTKQQLGYIVSSGVRALEESRTIAFVAQSSAVPVEKLTYEIVKFLDSIEQNILVPLPKGDLAVYVKGAIDSKTEPDKQLAVEVTRNWGEIVSGRFQFDRIQREAAALLDVTKEDLLEFWKTIYAGDNRRVLITQIIPETGAASSPEPIESTGYTLKDLTPPLDGLRLGIDDIEQFRRDRDTSN